MSHPHHCVNTTKKPVLAAVCAVLLALPLLYVGSIGPMSIVLLRYGGDTGFTAWDAVYGRPLGKLPRPCRIAVNKYLGASDKLYWKLRNDL